MITVTPPPIEAFPIHRTPFSNMVPFTYWDHATNADILTRLRVWLYTDFTNWVNENFENAAEQWNGELLELIKRVTDALANQSGQVNDAIAELTDYVGDTANDLTDLIVTSLNEQDAQNDAKNAALTLFVNNAVQSIINSTIAVTDPVIAGVVGNKSSNSRAILDERYKEYLYLEDFLLPEHNGDYSLALTAAGIQSGATGRPILLRAMYTLKSNIANLNGVMALWGMGKNTGFTGPANAPVLALNWTNATNVELRNFSYDGGVTSAMTGKNYTRGIRFRDSANIKTRDLFVRNCADWGMSFERCDRINVRDHTHENGGLGTPGGRDGIHLLDCSNAFINEADIWSGDDCVGITSENVGTRWITVKNIRGRSDIGSVVIANEEGSTTKPIQDITIDGVRTTQPSRNVCRVQGINSATVVERITITNVVGEARTSYGLWVGRAKDVSVSNCSVSTTGNAHGIYIAVCERWTMTSCEGTTTAPNFDGVNATNSTYGAMTACRSNNAALWGFQLNGCVMVTVTDCIAMNGGTLAFDSNAGGGIRVVNGADVTVDGGYFGGDRTYTGLSFSGSSRFRCTDRTRLGGTNPRSSAGTGINALQAPMASIHFKAAGLALTVQSSYRAQIDEVTTAGEFIFRPLNADGTVGAFRAAFPHIQIQVGHPSAAGTVGRRLIGVVTQIYASSFRFQVIDVSTGALASADYIIVTVWDQP